MKTKKRLFAGLLALAMLLSLNVTAFAAELTPTESGTLTLKKTYTVSEGVTAPAETLKFNVEAVSVTDAAAGITTGSMPMVTVDDTEYTTGNAANVTVNLPSYSSVGIYTYRITEESGTNGGVDYDATPVYLKVTVVREGNALVAKTAVRKGDAVTGEKVGADTAAINNTYNAADLDITKTVAGKMGDTTKYFSFTVTLTGENGKTYPGTYTITGGTYEENPETITVGETATVYLKDGDTVTIHNLPYGVQYNVVENEANEDGYTTDSEGTAGVIAASQTAAFTNTKDGGVIDTGVYLDNLPYIIIFAGVLAAVAVLVIRRRRADD